MREYQDEMAFNYFVYLPAPDCFRRGWLEFLSLRISAFISG